MKKNKRKFIKSLGLGLLSLPFIRGVRADYKPKIVIIGGGFGGGSCLSYLKRFSDKFDLNLIDIKKNYYTCPFSNYVIGGFRKINENRFSYTKLDKTKVNLINLRVKYINSDRKLIKFTNNDILNYDWLILSPGIGFKWDIIDGYNKQSNNKFPHAWNGGKVDVLSKKLDSLENNSKILISAPDYPYRCPPAPYERASMIAYRLKKKGIKFKIIILDTKNSFTKMELFFHSWKKLYPDSIDWISRKDGGEVIKFDEKNKTLTTKSGQKFVGDFVNIIPPQKAADVITDSELILDDWCEINPKTFELSEKKNIHVVGDSINAWDMPKSAFSATSQAKICAENIKNIILGKDLVNPVFLNTCYSLASPNYGFSISSWYRINQNNDRIVSLGSEKSSITASVNERKEEVLQSFGWYDNITKEIFG